MPFSHLGLSALSTAGAFTLWHYVTTDERATVLTSGYFAPAALALRSGDVIILQAADATALIPVRTGSGAGPGIMLDTVGAALTLLRSATLPVGATLSARIVARAIAVGPLPTNLLPDDVFPVSATVTGPVARLVFSLRDAVGALIGAEQNVPVVAGSAGANFTAPSPGGGYRIRVVDAADARLVATSPPLAVANPPVLLTEAGQRLLLESGAGLRI